jgi:chemotaxis protein methyltransferase CheR
MKNQKNIVKGILRYFLERSLNLRFDICTCEKCKEKMLKYLLAKFPPVYVAADDSDYSDIEKDVTKKYLKQIFLELNNAINYVSKRLPHPLEEDKEKSLENLLQMIKKDRGVDFGRYRRELLKRRIAIRMVANKIKSYTEYLKILAENPHEYEKLFETLTINVSEFFRDPPVWKEIRKILTKIIQINKIKEKPVTFWSAACAKGEEPYSLAILIRELGDMGIPLKIYATDIDKESLMQGKKGVYSKEVVSKAIRNTTEEGIVFDVQKYFVFKDGMYYVKDDVRNLVEFKYLDLTSSEYLNGMDMILCRNVFIYFTKPLQEQILDKFYRCLNSEGYLVTGETESLLADARTIFKEVGGRSRIYQKIGG